MADRVGQRFGNYILTHLLGKGGFAEVYRGEHIYLKSAAAIKVLLTQLGEDEIARFLAEARTLAGLKHPHIVHILDFGMEGDILLLLWSTRQTALCDGAIHGALPSISTSSFLM